MGNAAPTHNPDDSNQALVRKINKGDKSAYEQLFFKYYSDLCRLALGIVRSRNAAEDVVQNVFLNIWKNHKQWTINISMRAYLYRAVKNRAINFNKKQQNHRQTREKYLRLLKKSERETVTTEPDDNQKIVTKIWKAVEELPKKRRLVFILHRKHGLAYKEISQVMGISRKTVENHMGLALKQLRKLMNQSN